MPSEAILKVMVAMSAADHEVCDSEIDDIVNIYEEVVGEVVARERVGELIRDAATGGCPALDYLRKNAVRFDVAAKEKIIVAAYRVLLSDGVIAGEERKKLADIARAVGLREIHYKVVLESLMDGDEPPRR